MAVATREYKDPPSLWWGMLALAAMPLLLALMLYLGAWYWQFTLPKEVRIPSVTGLDEQAAVTILEQRGLRVRVPVRRYDERLSEGKVLEISPPVNRVVKQGRSVALTVSKGSRWTTVPDLREMALEQSRRLLQRAELNLSEVAEVNHDQVPPGYTVSQQPASGERVERNTGVQLIVSKGPKVVEPPPTKSPEATTKYAQVEVLVPAGEFRREVQITVQDDEGMHEVYREWKDPGSRIITTVQGKGRVTVRVLIDGEQVQEQTL